MHQGTRLSHRFLIITTGMVAAAAGGAGFAVPSPAATIELHCDQVPPDEKLGIQQTYQGGDCLPGPPGSPGNLVGLAFPFDNSIEEGDIVGVRLFFIDPTVSSMNIYLWSGTFSPRDSCGVELHRLLQAPIQGDSVYSDYVVDPPVPMALGQRIWLGAVYESTTFPPSWSLGRIDGPSQPGRNLANLTGDHGDWIDLHDFGYGQCFAVRLVLETNNAPVAEAGQPTCGGVGAAMAFDGGGSFDPDGDPLSYRWDFGDGATATGVTVSHIYGANGSYVVVLTASDASASSEDTTFAHIGVPFSLNVPGDIPLGDALALASNCPVDTIWVGPGTHDGPFVLTSSAAVIVARDGPAATELANDLNGAPVLSVPSGSPSIRGFRVRGNGVGIRAKAPISISDCWVVDCGGSGIVIDIISGAEISGCLVAGNSRSSGSGGGIALSGTHLVTRSTVEGNGGFAVSSRALGTATNPVIDRCILSRSLIGPALQCIGGAAPRLSCTDLWANAGGDMNCGEDRGENFSADPLFCDSPSGDFRLTANSPCLDRPGCGTIGAFDQGCGPISVTEDAAAPSASAFSLAPPAPNPFNLETKITLVLTEAARVRLIVNDVTGRRVRALEAGPLPAGTHRLAWDGKNDAGKRVTSGTYLLRLEAGARTLIERAVLLH